MVALLCGLDENKPKKAFTSVSDFRNGFVAKCMGDTRQERNDCQQTQQNNFIYLQCSL